MCICEGVSFLVELLAPAGSKEAFFAAVGNGANAVYLAGSMFGARAYAANFNNEELAEVIRYAHVRGVHVHVAVNTIVDQEELPQLRSYLQFLDEVGADAVLVQDLGAAALVREVAPHLPLHASTQMTVHHLSGVLALEALGFSRVVLARELTLDEIREICAKSHVEIECFVHGALCVCYSGQCLMSSMIGGRSGNRGRCAQPCRLPYTLIDAQGQDVLGASAGNFLLSPRDLNTIDLIPQLIDVGVQSLKIEGRMKRPEYVASVVHTYRKAIDHHLGLTQAAVDQQDRDVLAQVFNRDFTTAYLEKRQGKYMMSDRRPNNRGLSIGRVLSYAGDTGRAAVKLTRALAVGDQVDFWVKVGGRVSAEIGTLYNENGQQISSARSGDTVLFDVPRSVHVHDRVFKVYDVALMKWAQRSYDEALRQRIPLQAELYVAVDKPLSLYLSDDIGSEVRVVTDYIGTPAKNHPMTEELAEKQLNRLGTTAFFLEHLVCRIEGDVMVPVSELNKLRRAAIEAIEEKRIHLIQEHRQHGTSYRPVQHKIVLKDMKEPKRAALMVSVDSMESMQAAVESGADGILYGGENYTGRHLALEDYHAAWCYAKEHQIRIDFNTPRIVRAQEYPAVIRLLENLSGMPPAALHLHHIGIAEEARRLSVPLHADYSMISYNTRTLDFLHTYGFSEATLSPELNERQMSSMVSKSPVPLTIIAYGRLPLMVSEYCALGSFLGSLDTGTCTRPCHGRSYFLRDRKGIDFPIKTDQFCRMHILNSKILSLLPYVPKLLHMGISTLRIEGRGILPGELGAVTTAYRRAMSLPFPLSEQAQEGLRLAEGNNVTRGHYFRGVL